MNLLARSTDYAVRALLYLAQDRDRITSTAELEENLGLPRPFMRKTLQVLQQAGLLVSVKGRKGGFRLSRAPQQILLFDVMTVFQGRISLGECLFRKKLCRCVRTCPLRVEIKRMETMLLRRLKSITIAALLKDAKGAARLG